VILHRDGARRDDAAAMPTSAPEVARVLRRTRTRQGLRVEDVSARTGVPAFQLEALEAGTYDRLPDSVGILQALRRYAEFLGLPGDRYALALIDTWPPTAMVTAPPVLAGMVPGPLATTGPPTAAVAITEGDTGVVPAVPSAEAAATGVNANPSWGTGSSLGTPIASSSGSFAPVPLLLADTGVTKAVPKAGHADRRSGAGPVLLKLLVGVVGVLVVLGVAGLVVNHYRPQWLRSAHLPHSAIAATTTTVATAGTTHPAGPPVFAVTSSSAAGVTATVRAPNFVVKVIPVGGSSWVQVSDAQHATPIFTQVVPAGTTETFPAQQALTVEVGSSSARIFVYDGSKLVGFFFPQAAPFTMDFKSIS